MPTVGNSGFLSGGVNAIRPYSCAFQCVPSSVGGTDIGTSDWTSAEMRLIFAPVIIFAFCSESEIGCTILQGYNCKRKSPGYPYSMVCFRNFPCFSRNSPQSPGFSFLYG